MTFKKIKEWFFPTKPVTHRGSITFDIDSEKKVNISLKLPTHYTDMVESSEIYAEMLLSINYGFLFKDILNQLNKKSIDSKNTEEILLIDNIMFFWATLINQHQQSLIKKNDSKDPLISPSQVFATKN